MELAGVVSMPGGVRPDLLKHVLVKGLEAFEGPFGKNAFCVFNRADDTIVRATASAEPHGQHATAVPDGNAAEASAVKQTAITDFFSPCPVQSQSRCVVEGHTFITPCPSVRFSEVPVVFQVQSEWVLEDYLHPTRHLFEREVSGTLSESPSVETDSSPAQDSLNTTSPKLQETATKSAIDFLKRSRGYSMPSPLTDWPNRSVSESSNNETLLGSPAQGSDLLSPTSPSFGKGLTSKASLLPSEPAPIELIGGSQAEDTRTEEAERDAERYWVEKDQERLEVIANMEKTIANMKGELANTANAFQMASDANHKLQAELKKKITNLSQVEEDMNSFVHNLDVAEIDKEKLEKELAHSRRDQKRQYDRAEEALSLIDADPSKESVADLLQAKADAEYRYISQQRDMESEIDSLKLELKERCESVARLTTNLSRVADFDRWKDVEKELEELYTRADTLPDDLRAAWLESDKWKGQHDALLKKHEEELASYEKDFQHLKDINLEGIQVLKRNLKKKAAMSERLLKECLKQVFERMVRCSLCLESNGFLAFDKEHQAICEKVMELTGQDYQQALVVYYNEHEIQDEFELHEDNEEGEYSDHEEVHYLNNEDQARSQESDSHGDNREQDESRIGNNCNLDLHTSDPIADTLHHSSSAPPPVATEVGNVVAVAAKEKEVQELPEAQEARSKREVAHFVTSTEFSLPAAERTAPAVTSPSVVVQEQGDVASGDVAQTFDDLSADGTADEAADSHLPKEEDPVKAAKLDDVALPSLDEHGLYSEPPRNMTGNEVRPNESENDQLVLEDHCSTGVVVEGDSDDFKEVPNDVVPEGSRGRGDDEIMAHQRSAKGPISARDDTVGPRTFLTPKKQARPNCDNPVAAPAANAKQKPSAEFTFSKPLNTSKPAEATEVSTSASSNSADAEGPLAFGSGKFPPSSLFATLVVDPKEKSSGGSMSPEPLKTSKPAGATNSSIAGKGNSQDIWESTSFATGDNERFSFKPAPEAYLKAKSKENTPFFKSFVTSKLAEAKTPASEISGVKQGSEATEAHKQADPVSTKESFFPTPLEAFNFGGDGGPVAFTSSESFPARVSQPMSTGTTVQPGRKAAKGSVAKVEHHAEGNTADTEARKVKAPEEETSQKQLSKAHGPEDEPPHEQNVHEREWKQKTLNEESAPKEETPSEAPAPAPSEPSRTEKRAAKRAQKKAAKKAEKTAANAKAEENRRVQQALMMR